MSNVKAAAERAAVRGHKGRHAAQVVKMFQATDRLSSLLFRGIPLLALAGLSSDVPLTAQ